MLLELRLDQEKVKFKLIIIDVKKIIILYFIFIYIENDLLWASETDRDEWEEAQNRLDRQWYNLDEGVDETNNPFSDVSESYAKKKEQQLAQSKKKRMSAQQRQINKVRRIRVYLK